MNLAPSRAGLALVLTAACTVDGVDLSGLKCPCADPWVCDAARNLCLLAEGGGDGAVQVDHLRSVWSTSGSVRWQWDVAGDGDRFARYELAVATSENDLLGGQSVTVFAEAQNPELGRYQLPRANGVEVVAATVTDGHAPDASYFARLFAFDTADHLSVTNVASGRTALAPTRARVIFSEDLPPAPAYSFPPGLFERSARAPHQGTYHYEYTSACPNGEITCWENLRLTELLVDLSDLPVGPYMDTAFLEFAIASDAGETAFWSEASLSYGSCNVPCRWDYNGWTVRANDAYRVVQIPLRVLGQGDPPVLAPFAELAQGLFEFRVAGLWQTGATIRVDEVFVRW